MIKRLTSHGNSVALVIDKAILELLKMAADTTVELTTDGRNLIVSPVREAGREKRFKAALAKVNQRHGKTLKRLGE
jgi:antitoxin component of MazEF toxin-antitoxin module